MERSDPLKTHTQEVLQSDSQTPNTDVSAQMLPKGGKGKNTEKQSIYPGVWTSPWGQL